MDKWYQITLHYYGEIFHERYSIDSANFIVGLFKIISTITPTFTNHCCGQQRAIKTRSSTIKNIMPSRYRVHAYLHISWDKINPFDLEDDLLSKALEVHIYIPNVKIRVRVLSILMFLSGDWANQTTNHMGLWTWFRQEKEIQAMISFSWQLVQEDICRPWEDICLPCWIGAQISPFWDRIWTFRARMKIK